MTNHTILSSDLVRNLILPFLLIFAVVFAILEKSKILGEDKRQVNAIVSLVIALLTITFASAVNIINNLIPFLAVAVVIILVFMVLLAFVASGKEGLQLHTGIKVTLGIIIAVAVIIAILFATNTWDTVYDYLAGKSQSSSVVTNAVFILVIIGALVWVYLSGKKKKD